MELLTCLGGEDTREEFLRANLKETVEPTFLVRDDGPTTTKRRYVNSFLLTKMFETSRFNDAPLPAAVEQQLVSELGRRLPDADVVVVADFGQGFLGPAAVEALVSGSRFLALNAQTNSINSGTTS